MNKHIFLSCSALLLLVSLAAAPVLAATVTCPSDCSCLLPAEAAKINTPGLCGGKQMVCGYEGKNEKYCYEKAATPAVPMFVETAKPVVSTTAFVKPTVTATTGTVLQCPPGCTCLDMADGKVKGLAYCGGQQKPCGSAGEKTPLYCFALPAGTATVPTLVTGLHTILTTTPPAAVTMAPIRVPTAETTVPAVPCPPGCSCLEPSRAGTAGFRRCSDSGASCGKDPLGQPMYCYVPDRAAMVRTVSTAPTATPAGETVQAMMTATTAVPSYGHSGDVFSRIGAFFTSLYRGSGQEEPPVPAGMVVSAPCGYRPGFELCGDECVSLFHDKENCGECGHRCPGEWICCRGICTDSLYDEDNCGACGYSCRMLLTCCQGTCVDIQFNSSTCGGCGRRCGEEEKCCSGTCVRQDRGLFTIECYNPAGFIAAGIAGVVVITGVAEDNGEDYDRAPFCDNATACPEWMTCCSGRCRYLNTSVENCGSCGYVCPASRYCREGGCTNESLSP